MVIDLSGGTNATHYPITYLNQVPAGGWTSEYKLDKLVMRLIPPGTFTMGSPSGENGHEDDEVQHKVAISHPYYMGVFEVTQRQYERVMGENPSGNVGEMRPVENMSWAMIRGDYNFPTTLAIDTNSFMGRMRAKTGIQLFDLPTEAQWEYACRAGTTTSLNSGKNISDTYSCGEMHEVGRYYYNSGSGTAAVGSYIPNRWGFYDMHGNVAEQCLDWYGDYITSVKADPLGVTGGQYRVVRGGCYWANGYRDWDYSSGCRSANREALWHGSAYSHIGFRLCCETVSK